MNVMVEINSGEVKYKEEMKTELNGAIKLKTNECIVKY